MARPIRIEFPGALYHVTSRGDRQEDIYEDDEDRQCFLKVLGDVCEQYNWILHAYCLMNNHYHLLVETSDGNLSKGMRQLNGVYTQRYNRRHEKYGHVFQGRFKGIHIEKESYLLELSRYIVLNPVRARIARAAKDWPWSSYRATAGVGNAASCLTIDWILSQFSKRRTVAQKRYRAFVAEGKNQPSLWEELKGQVFLGSDRFVERLQKLSQESDDLSEIPRAQRRKQAKPLEHYDKRYSRDEAIVASYRTGHYSMKQIGDYFGLHYSRVSRIIGKAKGKT